MKAKVDGYFLLLDGAEKQVAKALREAGLEGSEVCFPMLPTGSGTSRRTVWWASAARLLNSFKAKGDDDKVFYWGPQRFLRLFLREACRWDGGTPVLWSHWERVREDGVSRFYGALGVCLPASIARETCDLATHLGNRFFAQVLGKALAEAGRNLVCLGKPWPEPREELLVPKGDRKVTLAMIARDEEEFLAGCLEQALPFVDAIVVVDTGSQDRTAETAECYGARLLRHEWRDDFAAARNTYLEEIREGWVLTLDADEYLTPEAGILLRRLAEKNEPKVYYLRTFNYHSDLVPVFSDIANVRLYWRTDDTQYVGKIHEQLSTSLFRELVGGPYVLHFGYLPEILSKKKKFNRNFELLEKATLENHYPFEWYNLGTLLVSEGKAKEGLYALEKYFQLETPETLKLRPSAYWHAARAALACGKKELALEYAEKACGTPLPECYFTKAQVLEALGRTEEAIAAYRQAAALPDPPASLYQIFNQTDSTIKLWRARLAAASLLEKEKRYAEAEREYRQVLEKDVANIFALLGLARTKRLQGRNREALKWAERAVEASKSVLEARAEYLECLISLEDFEAAKSFAETSVGESGAFSGLYLRLAQALQSARRWHDGIWASEKYLEFDPDHVFALLIYSRCLWNTGQWEKAQQVLDRAVELAPEDAEVANCYGSFLLAQGLPDQAKVYFEKALSLDPENGGARLNLARVHVLQGDVEAALFLVHPLINLGEDSGFKAEARIFSARCLIATGSPEQAIHLLEEEGDFQDATLKQEAWLVKGNAFYALGMYLEAVNSYWEAFRLNSEDSELLFRIALTMIKLNRLEDAENALLRLQEIDPSYPESQKLLSLIRIQRDLMSH
ncbi:MAG: tetratricopeptide repeat protein [Firmicutes bacterium]|nr:tetratricopeptide repeat protein [Bacillota bacterium]